MSTSPERVPAFYTGSIVQTITFTPPPEPQMPFDHLHSQIGRNGFQSYRQEPSVDDQARDRTIGMHFIKEALAKIEWAAHSGQHVRGNDLDLGPVGILKKVDYIHHYYLDVRSGALTVEYKMNYMVEVPV